MRVIYGDHIRKILENHYEWCKLNGRNTSWYKEYSEKIKCSNGNTQIITKK
jgi:hypothetical protein